MKLNKNTLPAPFTFTITTCNVLYEPYYVQYVHDQPMSIKKRCLAFKKSLEHETALDKSDILCFQEWPYKPGIVRKQFEEDTLLVRGKKITKKEYSIKHTTTQPNLFLNYLTFFYPPTDYYYLMDSIAEKDGVLTLINKHRFKILSYKFTVFTPNKKMLTAIITPHTSHYPLGIINAHIPFAREKTPPKELARIRDEIKNYSKNQPWIICGDFNYTVLQGTNYLNKEKYQQLKQFFPNMHSNAEIITQPTSTSSRTGFNLNDFIFFSKNIKPLEIHQFPELSKDLLRHFPEDLKKKNYFSDHAIIRMKLNIKNN